MRKSLFDDIQPPANKPSLFGDLPQMASAHSRGYTGAPDLPLEDQGIGPLDLLTFGAPASKAPALVEHLTPGLSKVAIAALKGAAANLGFMLPARMAQGKPTTLPQAAVDVAGGALIPAAAEKFVLPGLAKMSQGLPKAPTAEAPAPDDVVGRLTEAIKSAKPIRGRQERGYSIERGKRFGAASDALTAAADKHGAEAGFRAALSQMKGELPKAAFTGVRDQFSQPEVDGLFQKIVDAPLSMGEKLQAHSGLQKLLGTHGGGVVPQKGELSILREVYGAPLVDAALANRPLMQKIGDHITDVLNVPRTLAASVDLSIPFRQGLTMSGRKEFWKAWPDMVKSFGSEKVYQAVQSDIRSRPNYKLMRESGLSLTDLGSLPGNVEEKFQGANLAEKIPVVGPLVRGSARAATAFLNKTRADVFDNVVNSWKQGGVDLTEKATKDLAKFINNATGRGGLGHAESAAPVLNAVMFSPRLTTSRLHMLNPVFYGKLDPAVQKVAGQTLAPVVAGVGTVLGLAAAAGAHVETDPRNADFLKIRMGDTRYDVLAGFQQPMRLAAQLTTGKVVSSTTGKEMKLGDPSKFRALTRKDVLMRFLEGKENPTASYVTQWLEGKNFEGKPFQPGPEALQRLVPLGLSDIYDTEKAWGPKGALMGLPSMVGVGVQTYSPKPTKAGRKAISKSAIRKSLFSDLPAPPAQGGSQ